MKKSISGLMAIFTLLLLLTHPRLSCEGARQGLLLWSQTVLPTLLPFMICSNVIVALDAIHLLIWPFKPVLRSVFHLSDAGSYVLICGLLCGYPMGAKTCSEFLNQGRISQKEARYLLAISNHPSPMFVLGYVAANLCPSVSVFRILLSLYLPVIPVAMAARKCYGCETIHDLPTPRLEKKKSFDETMMGSIEIMVRIGGYIMLFSILAYFLSALPGMDPTLRAVSLGFVEITTGIKAISGAMSGNLQGFALTMITAFGGLSGIFQTKSVLKKNPAMQDSSPSLSIRHYFSWKLFHAGLSGLCFMLLDFLAHCLP